MYGWRGHETERGPAFIGWSSDVTIVVGATVDILVGWSQTSVFLWIFWLEPKCVTVKCYRGWINVMVGAMDQGGLVSVLVGAMCFRG